MSIFALVPNLQIGNRQGKLQLAKQHSQAELGNERNERKSQCVTMEVV